MASWSEIEREAPDLTAAARELLDAHKHLTLATLRRDGAPRISGTEIQMSDGEIWLGSMWGSLKALDLRRDPRFALHSGSIDPPDWNGDAKLAGRAIEVHDAARKDAMRAGVEDRDAESGQLDDFHVFRAEIEELSIVRLGEPADHLVIESWHPGRGVTRRRRD